MAKRPSKRPPSDIPPPPDTQPEGRGIVISNDEPEAGSAEDYYKRIHAHRTVLAMKAVRPDAPAAGMAVLVDEDDERSNGAQALLQRVFAAEKEVTDLRERLAERTHERDAARGEVLRLRTALTNIGHVIDAIRS